MNICLTPIDSDLDSENIVEFLIGNQFPYHVVEQPAEEDARAFLASGVFSRPENAAFWIQIDSKRVGIINFQDMLDGNPMIDIRLDGQCRGKGIGAIALGVGTSCIFTENPNIDRIEGNTRIDNEAMRRIFTKNGYVKEAHYRDGWRVEGAMPLDSVSYAIIRRDWMTGVVTPVNWNS
ncbi:hypothetical protein KEM60_02686 [Austwickia sp. TVS 96-490-7B]|uniref:GNAT family N-acetyltransferase n=1 Tax=Austwickia sp. TVS 96-490-7B TaxID=2830843 RepID=UPI001C55F256|nr:GNAT family protein [Austwickia sp. TVS 96-490-7B]MBW3086465.1 hypothetical protein [Austwickia sp. TVS 96-490-7B]